MEEEMKQSEMLDRSGRRRRLGGGYVKEGIEFERRRRRKEGRCQQG